MDRTCATCDHWDMWSNVVEGEENGNCVRYPGLSLMRQSTQRCGEWRPKMVELSVGPCKVEHTTSDEDAATLRALEARVQELEALLAEERVAFSEAVYVVESRGQLAWGWSDDRGSYGYWFQGQFIGSNLREFLRGLAKKKVADEKPLPASVKSEEKVKAPPEPVTDDPRVKALAEKVAELDEALLWASKNFLQLGCSVFHIDGRDVVGYVVKRSGVAEGCYNSPLEAIQADREQASCVHRCETFSL